MDTATARIDESVQQVFGEDHARMGEILKDAIEACRSSAAGDVRACFGSYQAGMRRHIRAEDEALFPAFEALCDAGPTAVMRREHREIERRLDQIGGALDGEPDLAFVERQLVSLQALLADHDRREEKVLYPACDRLFSRRERSLAVRALPGKG